MQQKQGGFTLLEAMLVITVIGVMLGLAVPNVREFIRNARLTSSANDLLADLHVARTESIKRREPVVLCSSANANATDVDDLECRAEDATEFDGWFAYVDLDADDVYDGGTDIVLLQRGPVDDTVTAKSDAGAVSYASSGFMRQVAGSASATSIAFCDVRGNEQILEDQSTVRVVSMLPTGRAGITRDYDEVSTVLTSLGGCP